MRTSIILIVVVLMFIACHSQTYPIRPEPADTVAQVDSTQVETDSLAILTERVGQLEKKKSNSVGKIFLSAVAALTVVFVLIPMAVGGN